MQPNCMTSPYPHQLISRLRYQHTDAHIKNTGNYTSATVVENETVDVDDDDIETEDESGPVFPVEMMLN